MIDRWGSEVAGGDASISAWDTAWGQALHFVDDPFETLANANATDDGFAMGSIFCGTYRVLAGARPDDAALQVDLQRASERASTPAERNHAEALKSLVAGNFTHAGQTWDRLVSESRDFSAVRFAHDVYLHVGDAEGRLYSSQQAFDAWGSAEPGWGFVAGQLSFALEETGSYGEAEEIGRKALDVDPLDLWARHSLAHVYESVDDTEAAFALLMDTQDIWAAQDGLAVHIWWHLALRLIATSAYDEALGVYDEQLTVASTAFRMCDLASLLWRLELVGVDVGDRWTILADRFAQRPEWHTSGFLDLHAALIYTRRQNHDAAQRFFDGVAASHGENASENDRNFVEVVQPLVAAIRDGESNPAQSAAALGELAATSHRIGGSIAQRDIIGLTRGHYEQLSSLNAPEAT